jgi:PKD repeat protein
MRKIMRVLFPLLLVISLFLPTIAYVSGEGVIPETHTATIDPEDTSELEISVTTGITPVSKLDVVFLFDVTGSMDWVSDTAKEKAHEITQSIIKLVEDTAFGVTYFADYPGDYSYDGYSDTYGESGELPYVLAQDVTTDIDAVSAAIDGLPYQYGSDLPESYTRAIYETQFMNWRSGAKKIVILFGDAPTHDEDFYVDLGYNYGGDPGRDGIANTADDLDFETVINQVSKEGITIMPIYCVSYPDAVSQLSFDYMAAQTNGEVVNIDDAALILPTIVSMVESQVETINVLTLNVPAEYVDYVSWTPETHSAVGPETTVSFVVTITNPGTFAETEFLEIPITALGDGVVLGMTVTTIVMVAHGHPPVASFTVDPRVAPVSQSLVFDASDSYDSDGSISTYSWDYGDGETGEGASTLHVYEESGEYLVTLTVVDESGATDTISLVLYIEPWDDVGHDDDHHGLNANPGEVAVTTVIATAGSIGAGLATGGANSLLNVGRVDEGLKKGKKVKRSKLGQAWTLFKSVLLIGAAYALVTAGTFSLGYMLKLPWSLPVIGTTLPVTYVSGLSVGLFLQALPAIFLSTGIVFLWRYVLETVTAKVLGIKIALVGNKIGAASLIGTTFLAHPYGFPMTTVFEGHVTVKDRGILSFMRNFGLLALVAPLLYIQREWLLGDSSFLVSTTGILIVLMTFFYTSIPYKGEGIDLFKWNKGIDLLLIAVGLALYFGYKTSMISTVVLMWASIGAAAVVVIFLLNLFRGRKQLIEDRRLEDYRDNSTSARAYDENGNIDENKSPDVGSKDEGESVPEINTPFCTECGKPATWIEQYKRWYCYDCGEYLPE